MYRKTSAALREQIAKAKAAKKAASRQATQSKPATEETVIPTDTTFDFGLADDPFNVRRNGNMQKMLRGRIEAARTTGRLNIAAMELKEIPDQVMKMYDLDAIGTVGSAWAESVDLTRFVVADNELEEIADNVFPDCDLQALEDDEDGRGNIFGGLETLDMHGNLLLSVPIGVRRLEMLTCLNLVSLLCFTPPTLPSCFLFLFFFYSFSRAAFSYLIFFFLFWRADERWPFKVECLLLTVIPVFEPA